MTTTKESSFWKAQGGSNAQNRLKSVHFHHGQTEGGEYSYHHAMCHPVRTGLVILETVCRQDASVPADAAVVGQAVHQHARQDHTQLRHRRRGQSKLNFDINCVCGERIQ